MAAKREALANAMLDQVLRNQSYTPPSQLFLALYTVSPTPTADGTEVSDAGTGYVRMPVTFLDASSGGTTNDGAVTWPASTGGYGGSNIVAVAICESSTVGTADYLYYGDLDTPFLIGDTDEPSFPDGMLVVLET